MKTLVINLEKFGRYCLHKNEKDWDFDENYTKYKLHFINTLYKVIGTFGIDYVVMVHKAKNPWRRDFMPKYKTTEVYSQVFDYEEFDKANEKFLDDVKKAFQNFQFMDFGFLEAKDIVYVLTKNFDTEVYNYSSDREYCQLEEFSNYHQVQPSKMNEIRSLNYKDEMQILYVMGDKSQDIMPIKRISKSEVAKMISSATLYDWIEKEKLVKKHNANYFLMNYSLMPKNIEHLAREKILGYHCGKFNYMNFMSLVAKHRLDLSDGTFNRMVNLFKTIGDRKNGIHLQEKQD